MHFHCFLWFFNYFLDFSRFFSIFSSMNKLHDSKSWNSWSQLMQNQLGLWWGPDIHNTHFNTICLICWFFILLDEILEFTLYLLLRYPCSHRRVDARYPGTLFLPSNSKILWMCMLSWTMTMFDAIFDCVDVCLIIFDKIHVMCHISKLNFYILW